MTRLKTSSGQFGLIGGICRAKSDCIRVQEPAPLSMAARLKGSFYGLAEPVAEGGRGYEAAQQVLADIAQHYYDGTSPSVTTCLARAIAEANRHLFEHNMQVSGHEKVTVGVTCAVVRGAEVFFAQVLPGQAYVVHKGRIQSFPLNPSWDPEAATLPTMTRLMALGWSEEVAPEFFHSPLDSGDIFCLCSSNIGRLLSRDEAEQVLLYQEPGDVVEQLYRRVHGQGFGEAHAVVVEMQPAAARATAPLFSLEGLRERARSVGETMAAWGTAMGAEVTRLFRPRPGPAQPYAKARPRPEPPAPPPAPEMPSLERPAPPVPWPKRVQRGLHNLLHPEDRYPSLERPRLRVGPARSERRPAGRAGSRFVFPLLVVGAILVLALVAYLWVDNRRQQYEAALNKAVTTAQQQIDAASQERDPDKANQTLDAAEQGLHEAIATLGASPRISVTLNHLRDTRDLLNNVVRFEELDLLVDLNLLTQTLPSGESAPFCPEGCALRNIVLITNTLYLLEANTGSVFEYDLARNTCALVLGAGVTVAGPEVNHQAGPILAIARVPRMRGGEPKPGGVWLAAIDGNQWLYLRTQGRWDDPAELAAAGEVPWSDRRVDLEGFNGYVYVLRGEYGQILRYDGAFAWTMNRWVTDLGRIKIENTVDIVIDGVIYALLRPEPWSIQVLSAGAYERAIAYRAFPREHSPTQIITDLENLDSPYLYVVDSARGRLLQLYKEQQPALVRQIWGPNDESLAGLLAATVRERDGTFYLAAGAKIFRAKLPPPSVLPSPTPAPSPTPE